jgi:hypothetical protein
MTLFRRANEFEADRIFKRGAFFEWFLLLTEMTKADPVSSSRRMSRCEQADSVAFHI